MRTKILLVDDSKSFRSDFSMLLQQAGYQVVPAGNREEGAQRWKDDPTIRMALVDLFMPDKAVPPERAGIVLITDLMQREHVAVAAITARDQHANLVEVAETGAIGFISKSWRASEWTSHVDMLAAWLSSSSALTAYCRSLELRNPYTYGHCDRVREFARALVPFLPAYVNGCNFDLAATLIGATVHDLGKIGFPDGILLGTRLGLTREERDVLKGHSAIGAKMLLDLGGGFAKASKAVLCHHRWFADPRSQEPGDYPSQDLEGNPTPRGEGIPLGARLMAVADALDALLSDRSYRPGLLLEEAMAEMRRGKGTQFCPTALDALEELCRTETAVIEDIRKRYAPPLTSTLILVFKDRKLTPGRLITLCDILRDIYLPDGPAMDKLVVSQVRCPDPDSERPVIVKLVGGSLDVAHAFKVLMKRMDEDRDVRALIRGRAGARESVPDQMVLGLSRAVPSAVKKTIEGESVVYPPGVTVPDDTA